jgi:hypothetical protein
MRHAVRQREAARADIRAFFGGVLDYAEIDLSDQVHPCELTGALVIDRRAASAGAACRSDATRSARN